jgi:hypothetical protein
MFGSRRAFTDTLALPSSRTPHFRTSLLTLAALAAMTLTAGVAMAQPGDRDDNSGLRDVLRDIASGQRVSARVSLPLQIGFFNGQPALYITPEVGVDPSAGDSVVATAKSIATSFNANYIPRNFASLPNSPAVDDILVFANGSQGNILASSPNPAGPNNTDTDYSPLWQISLVSFNPGRTPRVLKSLAAVQAAESTGDVTVTKTPIIVECSVVFTPRGGELPASRISEANRDRDDRR